MARPYDARPPPPAEERKRRDRPKPNAIVVKSVPLYPGVWEETYSDGTVVTVCDLTSALWRAGR